MKESEMLRWRPLSEEDAIIGKKALKSLHFDVHMAEHCNLNCKGCNHLSPLANEAFADIKTIERDFERLNYLGVPVDCILFLGGEPLLAPVELLVNAFCFGRKYFQSSRLILLTNGILIPRMNERFWSTCKQNAIEIQITKYPIKINYEQLKHLIESHDVKCTFDLDGDSKDIFRSIPIDVEGKQDSILNFSRCKRGNSCIILRDGKLYTCTLPAVIQHFNKAFQTSLEVCEQDFVDIYKVSSANDILLKLSEPIPFCRYCKINDYRESFNWDISDKDISEWT